MNIIFYNVSYTLVKRESTDGYISYDVFKEDSHIGTISKYGAEIHYTARDMQGNIKGSGATLRETLEIMVLTMFYSCSYKGDRNITTYGAWAEGEKVKVEFDRNGFAKSAERVVKYNKAAGDLYITLDNNRYFYYEFE